MMTRRPFASVRWLNAIGATAIGACCATAGIGSSSATAAAASARKFECIPRLCATAGAVPSLHIVRFLREPGRLRAMDITVDELRALQNTSATILNVGKHGGHREIRGAVRYRPHDLLTPERLAIPIAPDAPVVLYDEKGDGDLTTEIAEKLHANGFAGLRRAATFSSPPTIPRPTAAHSSAGVQTVFQPSSASIPYAPYPTKAKATAIIA